MAFDWDKAQEAIDLASRAANVNRVMQSAELTGVVPVGNAGEGSADLNVPYTAGLKTLYTNRREGLMQQAQQKMAEART